MTQWVKTPTANPDNLSSIPWDTHGGRGELTLQVKLFSDFYSYLGDRCAYVHIHAYKCENKI